MARAGLEYQKMVKDLSRLLSCGFLRLLYELLQCAVLRGTRPLARSLARWARRWMRLVLVVSHADCLLSGGYEVAAAPLDSMQVRDLKIRLRSVWLFV